MYLFTMPMNKTRKLTLVAAAALVALAVVGGATASSQGISLSLVAYSTPRPVMQKIIQSFEASPAGEGISFSQSYGPSTNQAKAVAAGQPADIVFLSAGCDMNVLVDAGLVTPKWNRQSYDGIAANTVVVFAVRDGNPKHIKSWNDLVRPGIQVITPNPFSSGSAKWNILAAYGAQRRLGKSDAQATAYVAKLFRNVVSQDTSAANATNTFLSGKGDILLTYESEALNANMQGKNIQYVIPRQTMLIQLPIAAIKSSKSLDAANAFIRYVKTQPAQELFAQYGFRPVNKIAAKEPGVVRKFPARPGMFTVDERYIGGWRKAEKIWFDPKNGRMVKIEQAAGGPTTG
jgi:sulfate/thiosulfate transport system substrate-binding protein